MKFKILIITVLTAISSHILAQNSKAKATAILDAMSKKYATLPSFNANFTYNTEGTKESYKGDVTVKGRKFKLKLAGQEIFNNEKIVSTYVRESNEVNITNFDPAEEGINPAKIYTLYKKGYKYNFIEEIKAGAETLEVVELIPEKANTQVAKIRISVNKIDKAVRSWKVFNRDGKKQNFKIEKFAIIKGISDNFFTFEKAKYPGVEVVDLR